MKWVRIAAVFLISILLGIFPAALAAELDELPGQAQWQPYLEMSPQDAQTFAQDPLYALAELLPASPLDALQQMTQSYADVLLFLLLFALIAFLAADSVDLPFLELVSASGCGVLLWSDMVELAQTLCEKMDAWNNFLLGFLPVYGGVLAAGGEWNGGTVASGFLLSMLCFLAQGISYITAPLLKSYLAVSIACCISTQAGIADCCCWMAKLLRKGLSLSGKVFAFLLGIQRVITLQLDRTSSKLGQLLTGSVPVVGQALSSSAQVILSGMQLLKSSLGIATFLILSAEFVPLYLCFLLHLLLLAICRVLARLAGSQRCAQLLECFSQAVCCMAAATALFYGLTIVGVMLLAALGGG